MLHVKSCGMNFEHMRARLFLRSFHSKLKLKKPTPAFKNFLPVLLHTILQARVPGQATGNFSQSPKAKKY